MRLMFSALLILGGIFVLLSGAIIWRVQNRSATLYLRKVLHFYFEPARDYPFVFSTPSEAFSSNMRAVSKDSFSAISISCTSASVSSKCSA